MNFTEFEFAQPVWLWGLLIPVLAWWLIYRYEKPHFADRLRDFADAHLLPHLIVQTQEKSSVMKRRNWQIIWTILWMFGIIALAGPRWDYEEQEVIRPQTNLMILLDLSESMQVKDLPHARLEQAIQEIEAILDQQQNLYVGLMGFAGIPHLIAPLTDDYRTLRHLLYAVDPAILPVQGSRLFLALTNVEEWLKGQVNKDATSVLLISDGEFETEDLEKSLSLLQNANFHLHALGVGTAVGKPIELKDGTWRRDAEGNVVISQLQENYLRRLTNAGQGLYQRAIYPDQDIQAILAAIQHKQDENVDDTTQQRLWHERFYLLIIFMMVIILPWFRRQTIHLS
jgi:Ca-activated chloride channel family protein